MLRRGTIRKRMVNVKAPPHIPPTPTGLILQTHMSRGRFLSLMIWYSFELWK